MKTKIRVFLSTILPETKDIASEMIDRLAMEDSFVICDLGKIIENHIQWLKLFPRVKPFYAVKCNADEHILKTLVSLGTGFDCASKGEIKKVLQLGAKSSDIIYAHPTKPLGDLRYAQTNGVDLMTFDNETELYKVKKLHPKARLVVRIRCDNEVTRILFGEKFGIYISELPHLLKVANKLDLNVVGIAFHVGSGSKNPQVFYEAIQASRRFFNVAKDNGFNFTLLDIGGGVPGHDITSVKAIAEVVNASLEEFFPEGCGVNIIAEPGRYYVTSSCALISQVHSIRKIQTEDSSTSYMYYINDGIHTSLRTALVDPFTGLPEILLKKKVDSESMFDCSIWGQTLDGGDKVCPNTTLPKLEFGDWLIFRNNGAYSRVLASPFNGFSAPKTYYVADLHTLNYLKTFMELENFVIDEYPIEKKLKEIQKQSQLNFESA